MKLLSIIKIYLHFFVMYCKIELIYKKTEKYDMNSDSCHQIRFTHL